MAYGLNLSEEELELLERMLLGEEGDIRSEHRRTRNPEFRSEIEHRMELQHRILDSIEQAKRRVVAMKARPFPG